MSSTLPDIDFDGIVARGGDQRSAFEELCCYLAEAGHPDRRGYRRLHGSGGDGGVECLIELADGQVIGIQAKYIFDVRRALTKAEKSFSAALRQYSDLTKFIVCIPANPTGPTARKGRSGTERIEEWIGKREAEAIAQGRDIQIEFWTASTLRSRLLESDGSEAAIRYYFDKSLLTDEWRRNHRRRVLDLAGPRYTPQSPVETTPMAWFRAFGRVESWKTDLKERITKFFSKTADDLKKFERAAQRPVRTSTAPEGDGWSPAWPGEALPHLSAAIGDAEAFRQSCGQLVAPLTGVERGDYRAAVSQGSQLVKSLRVLERVLSDDLDRRHYPGASSSPVFRQAQAEWRGSLPAANLDRVRRVLEHAETLWSWLGSPSCSLAFEKVLFLTGRAGAGKTHTVCDVLEKRTSEGLPTVATFGHRLDPARPLDGQLAESLGLPAYLTLPAILDLLDAEGRTCSAVTLICLEAVNEAEHRDLWPGAIRELVSLVEERRSVRFCVTCRTSFASVCLPSDRRIPIKQHPGFGDLDRDDVARYMAHYGLQAPTTPLLPPEFFNPLYLRLVCEAARSRGLPSIPLGWLGIWAGIEAFLTHKENEFSEEFGLLAAAGVVSESLTSLAAGRGWARLGVSHKDAVKALRPVLNAHGDADPGRVLSWLVGAGLLIEEGTLGAGPLSPSTTVRIAYDRVRDFLLARRLTIDLDTADSVRRAAAPGGRLHDWWVTAGTAHGDFGLIEALSILIPERHPGIELPDLVDDSEVRLVVLRAWSQSLALRDPAFYRGRTIRLAREALKTEEYAYDTMDALLANCWSPSPLDNRIEKLLHDVPLAHRDALWCRHLHESYERSGSVRQLIEAASGATLSKTALPYAERWAMALLWFTAAADGRVRDHATRAAIQLFLDHPDVILPVVGRLLGCDDDLVRERTLLSAYGALLELADAARTRALAETLQERVTAKRRAFDNAVLRDLVRCITDWANHLRGDLPALSPDFLDGQFSPEWKPDIPTSEECKGYRIHEYFQPVEFLSDFVKYTLSCLRRWEKHLSREEMARWMIRHISETLGYETAECHRYDAYMVNKYGPGRDKPVWAERIGKKYQRIALQRLASRLHDHIAPSASRWESSFSRSGLILSDERLFDPTVRETGQTGVGDDSVQIQPLQIERTKSATDKEWLAERDDLPDIRQLLSVEDTTGRGWWTLLAYWSGEGLAVQRHRRWIHVFAYLVDAGEFSRALRFLRNRNFYGKWMPEGRDLSGFVAEYPWGAVFADARAERSHYAEHEDPRHSTEKSFVRFEPAWNRVFNDDRYDVTMRESSGLHVPSVTWFDAGNLTWNGRDGYRGADGETVFRSPSGEADAAQLVGDPADLSRRLTARRKRLIWTALGEKLIAEPMFVGGRTFSQVAYLEEDGDLRIGKRMFVDYERNKAAPDFRNRFVKLKSR